ncbi:hypothetical protein ASC97_05620 [Rhizobium sp. Root1203]|uniref:hypothetical protein n=1 Tax=Rhizobium sp. Root1203 TaxID=1736427 RepID=UPI00071098A0|nr:hypothetical protein [Rhizobium sp. Root1203]KQV27845.1 hypothetical protein ASC97_05620 [Rhizobium sp. Root1203]
MTKFDTEKLEVLDGSRAGPKSRAAVRLEDLADLLQLGKVKTAKVTAAPTATDFNSLLDDIREISDRLNAVALSIQKRQMR